MSLVSGHLASLNCFYLLLFWFIYFFIKTPRNASWKYPFSLRAILTLSSRKLSLSHWHRERQREELAHSNCCIMESFPFNSCKFLCIRHFARAGCLTVSFWSMNYKNYSNKFLLFLLSRLELILLLKTKVPLFKNQH